MADISYEVTKSLFNQREYNASHLAYETEFAFYEAVKSGDLEKVKQIMLPLKNEQLGHLSDNGLRNIKYHLVVTIALITRFCIEGGMRPEDAYILSDIYIQTLDKIENEDEVTKLHQTIVFDYTKKMQKIRRQKQISLPVNQVIDYIYNHLHGKITLTELADHVHLNTTYLCDLFKKETGLTLNKYIKGCKIDAAKNMLQYSDYPPGDIALYLGFSSHSHFISVFKSETGITPKQFRDMNYRTHFSNQ